MNQNNPNERAYTRNSDITRPPVGTVVYLAEYTFTSGVELHASTDPHRWKDYGGPVFCGDCGQSGRLDPAIKAIGFGAVVATCPMDGPSAVMITRSDWAHKSTEEIGMIMQVNLRWGREEWHGLTSAEIGQFNRYIMFGENDEAFPGADEWARICD